MRLEPGARPEHALRVSARLITSSTILHLSSDEMESAVNQEQMENPALEVHEQRICLFCGTPLYGQVCSACGHSAPSTHPLTQVREAGASEEQHHEAALEEQNGEPLYAPQQIYYDIDNYGFVEIDSEEMDDPLARIPTGEPLAEALLQQLEALVAPDDAAIAEQLVGNLNERGYLEIGLEEIAARLAVPLERVEYVLCQLHTLEPLGIGARNLRECLLLQLDALSEQAPPHPLARPLIEHYLDQLGQHQVHELARKLQAPEHEIRQALRYIRTMLHPFPAHIYRSEPRMLRPGSSAPYIRPDLVIRRGPGGFEVEVIEEKRYSLTIATEYSEPGAASSVALASREAQRYLHDHRERARFFVECVQRRWRTLSRVANLVVDYQRDFLEHGVRALRPLTRAEVAQKLDLDEGTVSRATANKYALLPNGRLMPLSDFFDSSLGVKDVLRELIQGEDPRHRLSDEELARLMSARGIPMARRTVTKYREEMGIGSSRER
jgi:RNA polymerase sigma-54 factor